MTNLNILIVEGNDPKNNEFFVKAAKASCSGNLKNLVLKLEPNSKIKIINPTNDNETKAALANISNFLIHLNNAVLPIFCLLVKLLIYLVGIFSFLETS